MSIGMHVSKKGRGTKSRKMNIAIADDVAFMSGFGIKNPTVQIFVTGPKAPKETLTDAEKVEIQRYIARTGTKCVIHGAYIDRPWSGAAPAIANIVLEMQVAARIGATGVIVHLSSSAQSEDTFRAALVAIGEGIAALPNKPTLWLEVHAAKPSEFTYETPIKIQRLFERVRAANVGYPVGFCIDTAHLFSCGRSLETYDAAKDWIAALPHVPIMMHLNDSARELGCGMDQHEVLCEGSIWKHYHPATGKLPFETSGLCYLLNWAIKNDIVTILERDDADLHKDLRLIQALGYFA
jgi:endonuclease IV